MIPKLNRPLITVFSLLFVALPEMILAQSSGFSVDMLIKRYKGKWPASASYMTQTRETKYNRERNFKDFRVHVYPEFHRIDDDNVDDGNSVVYRGDSLFRFQKYKLVGRLPYNHYPTDYILGDIYFDSPAVAKERLRKSLVDPDKSCTSIWHGKKVFVLGVSNADDKYASQVWYDAEGLYPVRFIDRIERRTIETRYEMKFYGNFWFPSVVKKFTGSKQTENTVYTQVFFNKEINPDVFSLDRFGSAHWYEQP